MLPRRLHKNVTTSDGKKKKSSKDKQRDVRKIGVFSTSVDRLYSGCFGVFAPFCSGSLGVDKRDLPSCLFVFDDDGVEDRKLASVAIGAVVLLCHVLKLARMNIVNLKW